MIRGIAYHNEVRFYAAYTRATVGEAQRIHDTSPVCTAALGRLLTAGAMMGAMGKNESDLLTLKIDGDGPIGQITVTANAHAQVKGLLEHNNIELPLKSDHHLDVGRAVGRGTLSVIRDLGLREPYIGQTSLVSGEIAEDITYYFAESEQIPTVVALGVLVDTDRSVRHAGGFILQLLPFASEETISSLERTVASLRPVTEYFSTGAAPEEILRDILGEIRVEDTVPVSYHCDCSRERVTRALISLGKKELQDMIEDGDPVSLHCDFCGRDYLYEVEELQALLRDLQH